jgi:GAF domain-containing protein
LQVSRLTVRAAMSRLQQDYGIDDQDTAFSVLREASQRHNVKLRALSAVLIDAEAPASPDGGAGAPPPATPSPVSFCARAGQPHPNRTDVLSELLQAARTLTGAECGTVQLTDRIFGGLTLEGHSGFDRDFLDAFGYVGDTDTPCGLALAERRQLIVEEVVSSPMLGEAVRERLTAAGCRSVISTPMLNEQAGVCGVVSVHDRDQRPAPTETEVDRLQIMANECARWLQWYETTVLGAAATAARATAAVVGGGDSIPAARDHDAELIAAAAKKLTQRFGIEALHAGRLLSRIAASRGISEIELATQLLS